MTDETQLLKCMLQGCSYTTYKKYELNRHQQNQHDCGNTIKCPACDKPFLSGRLAAHTQQCGAKVQQRVHDHNGLLYCSKCCKEFTSSVYLYRHKKQCGLQPKMACPVCDYSAKTKECLQDHLFARHNMIIEGTDILTCEKCGIQLPRGSRWRKHKEKCILAKKYECTNCKFVATTLELLQGHAFVHHGIQMPGVKVYNCEFCSYKSTKSTAFKRHTDRHQSIRKWECSLCEKKFVCKLDLTAHMRIHMEHKQYKCSHCNFSTKTLNHLKRHLKNQHELANCVLFGCPYCTRQTKSRGNCFMHVKHKHPAQPQVIVDLETGQLSSKRPSTVNGRIITSKICIEKS